MLSLVLAHPKASEASLQMGQDRQTSMVESHFLSVHSIVFIYLARICVALPCTQQ